MLALLAFAVPTGTAAAQAPAPADTGGAAYGVIPAKRAADARLPGPRTRSPPRRPCPAPRRSSAPTATPRRRPRRPPQVQEAIAAANEIIGLPYRYGGGHRLPWKLDRGYDCSGTVC